MHIFSSVGLHFLTRTYTRTPSRTRGVMAHGPRCFRLLTINTTRCKNLEKIAKSYGALRQSPRWIPMEPDGRGNGARTPMFQILTNNRTHCKNLEKIAKCYGALRQGSGWVRMGKMGQPLKKTTTDRSGQR